MRCCGPLNEITTQDDRTPVYICGECGKQGPPSLFPDEMPEPEPQLTRFERFRFALAELLARLVGVIAPK